MTEYSFKSDYDSISFVINDLSKNPNLTDWEKKFINDVKQYFDIGGFLSEKQLQVLDKMWEKY